MFHNYDTPTTLVHSTKAIGSRQKSSRKGRQPFTKQKTGQRNKTLIQLDDCLSRLAGSNDPLVSAELLKSFILSRRGKFSLNSLKEIQNTKLTKVMENLKTLHRNSPNVERNSVLATVSSVFPKKTLNVDYGFGISAEVFCRSRKRNPGEFTNKKKSGGHNRLNEEKVDLIRRFFYREDVSRESANRTVLIGEKGNKIPISARFLLDNQRNLYSYFLELNEEGYKPSFSTFRKYMPIEMKEARRETDLCQICAEGEVKEGELNKLLSLGRRTPIQQQRITKLREELELINKHRTLEKTVREIYNKQKETLQIGDAIIVMDFKENMKLGRCASETSRHFYDTPQRSVFTIAVYTRRRERGVEPKDDLKLTYFTFISECLKHDTEFVFDCLKEVMATPRWRHLRIRGEVNFWVDNAPQHFRTFELLNEFKNFSLKYSCAHLNYFVEYHGKCVCDSHFSLLSRYYSDYSKRKGTGDKPIYNTKDFIKLLEKAVQNTNNWKAEQNKKKRATTEQERPLLVSFFEYKREVLTQRDVKVLKAPNFSSYYHFELSTMYFSATHYERTLKASLYRGDTVFTHSYPAVEETIVTVYKTSKQGWTDSQSKPFTTKCLSNKEKFRMKVLTGKGPSRRRRRRRRFPEEQIEDRPEEETEDSENNNNNVGGIVDINSISIWHPFRAFQSIEEMEEVRRSTLEVTLTGDPPSEEELHPPLEGDPDSEELEVYSWDLYEDQ